jgi:hypothetical protein
MIRPLTKEDKEAILNRSGKIEAIRVFRSYMDLGLIGCKRAVEAIWEGRMTVESALGQDGPPKEPCPHCRGTGYVDSQ